MQYTVREITTRKDIRKFIKFPDRLYKGCKQYVPALHSDQMHSLTKCAPLQYCKRKMWLAYDQNGRIAGRICGMINPRYNELYNTRRARFGWFDCVNDIQAAKALFAAAEEWARSEGMNEIHGPLYYNTMGKQGMVIEGYENLPVFNTYYNYPYYNNLVTALGYEKECDWVENRMHADHGVPAKMERIAGLLKEKYGLREGNVEDLKKDPYAIHNFFEIYNEAFASAVHNFVPLNEAEIEEEKRAFVPRLSDKTSSVILDKDGNVAAFGIAIPDISRALQKAKGRMFPFGWFHLWRALHNYETLDLMINGASPQWRNRGISAVFHLAMSDKYQACGAKWALSNPQIETNSAVNVWSSYEHTLHMRRRCYIKTI